MLKAIIKEEICGYVHPSHGIKSGVAYPVTQVKKDNLYYGRQHIRVMTPGGKVLGFFEGEYELVLVDDLAVDSASNGGMNVT